MTKNQIRKKFDELTIWRHGDQRAPHKPLLLLYALGRCLGGAKRLMAYSQIDKDLRSLLIDYGPHRKAYHTEYPFWRLQNDGIWELTNADQLVTRKSNTDAKKSELLKSDIHGGLSQEVYEQFSQDKYFAVELAHRLLDAHFPKTIHDDILKSVGINVLAVTGRRLSRDPGFRDKILQAYEYQCAICGFDVRLRSVSVALEAAHIKWHQAGGPDTEVNGVALCSLHHKLFDRGVFAVTESLKIVVSERANGSVGFQEWLMAFHGRPLRRPQRKSYFPDSRFTQWHISEVFHGPYRIL